MFTPLSIPQIAVFLGPKSQDLEPHGDRGPQAAARPTPPSRPSPISGSLKAEPRLSQAGGSSMAGSHQLSATPGLSTWPPHLESPGNSRRHTKLARRQSPDRR